MLFSTLSSYFEKLEATASRLALIDILADLFKHSSKEEIEKIIYLTQGRIAPFFEATEIGMAEKQVASAIAASLNLKREEVLKSYSKLGDMGLAMQSLNLKIKNQKSKIVHLTLLDLDTDSKKPLSVQEVLEVLTQIAKTSGLGTVEKRQSLLANLLRRADEKSAKYLVRIPLGNLRLGVGDPTILDGLAKAKLGDKSKRKLLEGAYNRTSDLGLIAKTLWEKGLGGVSKLQVIVGKPIRSELCERLPSAEKVIEKMKIVSVQPKYDGFRVQIHKDGEKISMFSRNLENMTNMLPELITGSLKQIKAKSAILDTEALAYNPDSEEFLPFQETTKRRRKYNIEETAKVLPLRAFAFDILYKDGQSLIDEPLSKRLEILNKTLVPDDTLIMAKTQTISDPKLLNIMLEDSISKGLEGVVIKKLESPYAAGGRNFNWVKLKRAQSGELNDTIDCVILGYVFGKGKRTAFGAGALLVGVYDDKKDEFVTVSKIGTGLSDEEWQEIHKRADKIKVAHKPARVNSVIEPSVWIKPEIVIEVLADEITRSPIHTAGSAKQNSSGEKEPGYALRFPRLVSFRTGDKKPEDATTVKELIEMHRLQNKK
ncbi:MAG: DNA ligase [Candidatus Levybacteria bacterium RIFCSPLOWO2_01_FULL_39_24]|nr:MAG: DNA ligase [Candidatus Levybacteria bacterium RIFCSPHIGHO2_01_FULL_40_16]OGH27820.1 MAG: DNA ligase [Candidatus Levybacteria bacterium RIFCSPHIGHO2_12_FULL_39_9]OGH46095.1 MAG: DNA ligase [Candidatus Levybacteria bacterium RIFCSPLOWO2_01_FULL_39_24]